jgi:2-methylcitrate dehydratase PrpD
MTAAFLAAKGFTASERILEAPRGFSHVLSAERDLTKLTANLGEKFEIMINTYKPYPCGVVLHPAIDACLELLEEHKIKADDISQVELKVNFLCLR